MPASDASPAGRPVTIKAKYGDDLRRIQLPANPTARHLRAAVAAAFSLESDAQISWLDEDNDWVTIANDDDFNIALESVSGTSLLRVQIELAGRNADHSASKPSAAASAEEGTPEGMPNVGELFQQLASALPGIRMIPPHHFGFRAHPQEMFKQFHSACQRFHNADEIPEGSILPAAPVAPGNRGPGVEQLQRFLIQHGLLEPNAIRCMAGVYGPLTARAVRAFQKKTAIVGATKGQVDEVTRAALLALHTPAQDVEKAADPPSTPTSAAPSDRAEWSAELEQLAAMGFEDAELLLPLLEQFQGSINTILAVLLDDESLATRMASSQAPASTAAAST